MIPSPKSDSASSWYSDMTDAQLNDAKSIAQSANAPGTLMRVLAEQLRRADLAIAGEAQAKFDAWERWRNSQYTDSAALAEWTHLLRREALGGAKPEAKP